MPCNGIPIGCNNCGEPCDFMRHGELNSYSAEVVIPAGTFSDNEPACEGCDELNGQTYQICECPGVVPGVGAEDGTQTSWQRTNIYNHLVCQLGGGSESDLWLNIMAWITCANDDVLIRIEIAERSPSGYPPPDPWTQNCDFPPLNGFGKYRLELTSAEFVSIVETPGAYFEVPYYSGSAGLCGVDTSKKVLFRLISACGTTTTTTPAPYYCVMRRPNAAIDGDCLSDTACEQLTSGQVDDCLGSTDCLICDSSFPDEATCLASTFCTPPTTTTTPPPTTTTTTPAPYFCCSDVGDDCYGTVTCSQGGCAEGATQCGGPYSIAESCTTNCHSLTTTSPPCSDEEAADPCTAFSCHMICTDGAYAAPVYLFSPPCQCNPSPADLALIGTPCDPGDVNIVDACNPCSNATVSNTCPTTTTPAP